eukprot:TRINITY_DN13594_c0_g3_i1.p2 TRINITY_DN13594_c0_g3~~TRINITY_DN13594_c0_g3_i1.p2  ORF type:complete len:253 (-),score=19.94 TRINITY_DN13594_c0_g3_i1:59-763(-)
MGFCQLVYDQIMPIDLFNYLPQYLLSDPSKQYQIKQLRSSLNILKLITKNYQEFALGVTTSNAVNINKFQNQQNQFSPSYKIISPTQDFKQVSSFPRFNSDTDFTNTRNFLGFGNSKLRFSKQHFADEGLLSKQIELKVDKILESELSTILGDDLGGCEQLDSLRQSGVQQIRAICKGVVGVQQLLLLDSNTYDKQLSRGLLLQLQQQIDVDCQDGPKNMSIFLDSLKRLFSFM